MEHLPLGRPSFLDPRQRRTRRPPLPNRRTQPTEFSLGEFHVAADVLLLLLRSQFPRQQGASRTYHRL